MLQGAPSFASRLISLWSRFDLAFQPPFPRNKPVPFKGAVNRRNWLKTMSGLRSGQYKVMLIWREHPAAMSAVPLGTATSAVIKRNSVTQALLQRLPSAFPLWSGAQMLFVEKNMCIWPQGLHWGVISYKVMLIWREHSAAMSAVPLGTATSAVIKRSSGTQALLQCLPSAFPMWIAAKRCSL